MAGDEGRFLRFWIISLILAIFGIASLQVPIRRHNAQMTLISWLRYQAELAAAKFL